MNANALLSGIETGGTQCRVVTGTAEGRIVEETVVKTRAPEATLDEILDWLMPRGVAAIGVAAFGPIDVDPTSRTFGTLLGTPKEGWSETNLVAALSARLSVPIALDTDVNGAALAEAALGAARGCRSAAYVTGGTGVGVGLVVDGKPVHGLLHPELGHLRVRRHPTDRFAGACSIHGDCLEGIASGPALRARTGADPASLPESHEAFDFAAHALGEAVAALVLAVSPERIVIGGGAMRGGALLPRIRAAARAALANYPPHPRLGGTLAEFVVAPALAPRSGAIGALLLAGGVARD